jgi:hypothetical protein
MRAASSVALSAALAGALFLTACGSRTAGSGSPGDAAGPTCAPSTPAGDPADLERDGVRITSQGCDPSAASAGFEVTNTDDEPLTYTITFSFRSDAGEVMSTMDRTVASLEPGRTVTQTVKSPEPRASRVTIRKVRAVPADEAANASGACPPSGVRVTVDEGNSAMGLRVVGLNLQNCGTGDYLLNGYPALELLDQSREPVRGVEVLQGTRDISTGVGPDEPPRPVSLKPGESARATLAWRNTTEAGLTAVDAPYVRVTPKPGSAPATVTPELDLGTTGKLGVGPWRKG